MPSLQAKLLNQGTRFTLQQFLGENANVNTLRKIVPPSPGLILPSDVTIERTTAPAGEWLSPKKEGPAADKTILYLHGGGYVFCTPKTHRALTTRLAKQTGAKVFSVDYRLAPEHPYPAALEDALAAWDYLMGKGIDPKSVYVGGDSAGGGLTLALIIALKERGSAVPGGAFLYSPWADLSHGSESVVENEPTERMLTPAGARKAADMYRGSVDATDPKISPVFADFAGFPPLLVFVSTTEMLRDDGRRVASRAKEAGVPVELVSKEGLVHAWPLLAPLYPEANTTIGHTARWIVLTSEASRGTATAA
ncbi:Lipolytic enzyme [Parvularcula bermudensis HTCC2503]|uniref:Lipolytic enzyme n=1 Tax=Parvularcula bermudensis (strain ATCC BAA-594 / HTCC2503 / KCTC 12087) TaxID=314260 RepID=E0THQ1_PARBH|nr:alpha/beta hydrolase [Parvularcula bermudensis]ADM09347.1 Lipolytic enzyme [Parvularcula bermudensis HTCC2503]